jgi:GR25 family glycosyltransferase involved in LPS biosynthesis
MLKSNLKMDVYVINLDRRKDRWMALTEHARNVGVVVNRFSGSDSKQYPDIMYLQNREKNAIHCIISHKTLLKSLKENDDSYVIIGEDDFRIKNMDLVKVCLEEFKNSAFDICNIGFDPTWMPEFNDSDPASNLEEIKKGPCLTAHFYAIKIKAIPKFFEALEFCGAQLLCGKLVYTHALDHAWCFPQFSMRVCVPKNIRKIDDMVVVQAEFTSDINV